MIGQSLVEGCTGKVTLEMFNPSEEDIVLHKNMHTALVHPGDIEITEQQEEDGERERFCKEGHKKRAPTRRTPAGMQEYPVRSIKNRKEARPDYCMDIKEFFSLKENPLGEHN